MRLLAVNLARVSWWGRILDFNIEGINYFPLITNFLVQTYNFKTFPDPEKAPPGGVGWEFKFGNFKIDGKPPLALSLTLYSDSFMADTVSNTDHSDAFLLDMFTNLSKTFKFRDYNEVIRKKTYVSQVYVSIDKSLQTLNPKLSEISKFLSNNTKQTDSFFDFGGMSFWSDPEKSTIGPFTFERAATVPFSENRYFSMAPLPTNQHVELLNKLENILD